MSPSVTDLASWSELHAHHTRVADLSVRDLVAAEPERSNQCALMAAGIHADWSRQRIDQHGMALLRKLALERDISTHIADMFAGVKINNTEHRAVLHTVLRADAESSVIVDGHDVVPDVQEVLTRMRDFTRSVLTGSYVGATGKKFTDVVNIGIGGSDLGPVMVTEALKGFQLGLRPHFISNVDPTDAFEVLRELNPETTLVLIASKTFTTAETMANATQALAWLKEGLPTASNHAGHLAALSTAIDKAAQMGIPEERVFGFWDWVGGRYSVSSAIGLSIMLSVGEENFNDFLAGMHAMDEHFRSSDIESNLPITMALLGIWNRNFLDIPTLAVLPYEQYLHRLPAYLQQLTMESNGKRVDAQGQEVPVQTAAVLWGEPGTNGQHSFHQMIHQGTQPIAADVIAFAQSAHDFAGQHATLLANALAQIQVMAFGRTEAELTAAGVPTELVAHKAMPGNRPCTLLLAQQLTPATLGALVALYEHITFVQGVMWGINSFDQWGVEYGKEVATALTRYVSGDVELPPTIEPLTAASLQLLRTLRAQS